MFQIRQMPNSTNIYTPGKPINSLRNITDYSFCFFLIFASVLGGRSIVPLFIFGLAPVFWVRRDIVWSSLSAVPLIVKIAIAAYFLHSMAYLAFYPGIPSDMQPPPNPSWELYLVAILMLLIGFIRGADIDDLRIKFKSTLAPSLYISFLVLTVYAILDVTGDGRVQAAAAWPFIPALLFSMWAFIGLIGWPQLSSSQRLLRLGLISLSIVVVHGYTGSRGVGLAHTAVTMLLLLTSVKLRRSRDRWPSTVQLIAAVIVGLMLFSAHQASTANGALLRLQHISDFLLHYIEKVSMDSTTPEEGAQPPAPTAKNSPSQIEAAQAYEQSPITSDASTNVRVDMWLASLEQIYLAPVLGHGALSMKVFIEDRFGLQHNHNQFLSWLLTGGLPLLLLGITFMLTPFLATRDMPREERLVILLSTFVLWGVAMMFDSFLSLKFYLHYFCLFIGVVAAAASRERLKSITYN